MLLVVSVRTGRMAGTSCRVDEGDVAVVGRSRRSTLPVDHPEVSRHHCSIEVRGERVVVTDLGSANGTWINGERISVRELHDGDALRLGTLELGVEWGAAAAEPVPVRLVRARNGGPRFSTVAFLRDELPGPAAGAGGGRNGPAVESLLSLYREIGACGDPSGMAGAASRAIRDLRGPNRVALLVLRPAGDALDCFSGPLAPGERPIEVPAELVRDAIDQGVTTLAQAFVSAEGGAEAVSACIPLACREGTIGCLLVQFPGNGHENDADLAVFRAISDCIATTLERDRLIVSLDESLVGAVRCLVATVEARDPYTRGHSERVTQYSLGMARLLNLDAAEMEVLEIAGLLHDVGKIAVPQAILHNPAVLAREEFVVMREHPVWGAEIVHNIRHSNGRRVEEAVRHHHERWDGQGYPDGLAGEGMSVVSRVLAIADAYDAMTSTRPYRAAMSREHGLEVVCQNAGTQFDPDLVGLLPAVVDAVERDSLAGVMPPRRSRYAPSQALHQLEWRE